MDSPVVSPIITLKQFIAIIPHLPPFDAGQIVQLSNFKCPEYGITTKDQYHEFFATVASESGGFTTKTESLYYTHAERLCKVFHKEFPTIENAKPYLKDAAKLAERVYGYQTTKGQQNGNTQPGDGFKYRGGGFIQLTGKGAYTQFWEYKRRRGYAGTLDELVTLIRTSNGMAFESALWEFAIVKKLIDEAERDEFKTITLRINGGLTNYEDRLRYLQLAKKYII